MRLPGGINATGLHLWTSLFEFMHIALVIGTRPEAIKLAPIVRELKRQPKVRASLVSTGQHRELLDSTLASLELEPSIDLELMRPMQTLDELCAAIHRELPPVLAQLEPDAVLVQGDTTTAMVSALCAFHQRIPVGHVEAGLRTRDLDAPFPEEANRQLIARLARWCFAPTEAASTVLRHEGIESARISTTGNTAIDSLLWALERRPKEGPRDDYVLLTLHRRESFGGPLTQIFRGVADFLSTQPEARVIWPVHPNPEVEHAFERAAPEPTVLERFERIDPPAYLEFATLLAGCRLALSDSGGVQEEAPSLGKPVLIARDATERPEAVAAGLNQLVGREAAAISEALRTTWAAPPRAGTAPFPNPYGDGHAAERIVARLLESTTGHSGLG